MSSTRPSAAVCALFWFSTGMVLAGPAGVSAPDATTAVRIGILAEAGPTGDALAAGAEAAAADWNGRAEVNRPAVRLYRLEASSPWRDGATLTARLVFDEDLAVLVGPSDSAAAHVAAQIATVKRIPVITLSPEDSLTQVFDPWIFRGIPGGAVQARAVLRWAFDEPEGRYVALVVPEGREGRERSRSLESAGRDLGMEIAGVVRVGAGETTKTTDAFAAADALLLWLDPEPAKRFLEQMDPERCPELILGSTRIDDPRVLAHLPHWIETLALPLLRPDRQEMLYEALGYDMVTAIASAARRAGATPAKIREELSETRFLTGRSGTFQFDKRGNRTEDLPVGVIRGGTLESTRSRGR